MNKCIFMGRLGNTPELRYTKNNVAVCTFTIAVDRPRQKDKGGVCIKIPHQRQEGAHNRHRKNKIV